MTHFQATVAIFGGIAVILAGIGVIYRKLIRPFFMFIKGEGPGWAWVREQLQETNGEGSLRDQVTRIEDQQSLGSKTLEFLLGEIHDLRSHARANREAIIEIRRAVAKVEGTTQRTETTVGEVQEKVVEVADAVTTTGELPITE